MDQFQEIPPTVEITGAISDLVAFHINQAIAKMTDGATPYYDWNKAFGVSVCDLNSGEIYFDTLVHSIVNAGISPRGVHA